MTISPSAVRVKKSSGWQDIAIVGPPGPPGGEYELASAVGTADVPVPALSPATATTIITLPSVTFDGITTVIIEFWSRAVGPPNNGANAYMALGFWQDGVQIGSNAPLLQTPVAGNMAAPFKMEARITPAAGAHTFSIRAWVSANSGAYVSGGQNPGSAMFARVKRVMPPPTVPTSNNLVPRCLLRNTGFNQAMTLNTWTPLTWGVEHYDTDNMHDAVNPTRITFRTAGYYRVTGNGYTFGGVASNKAWRIVKWPAGLVLATTQVTNIPQDNAMSLSAEEYFAVGDYVTFEHHPGAEANSNALGTAINFSATMSGGMQGPPGPSTAIPLVSSLPASPVDGQEIYYLADATNGVIWHLRYRASSASIYKWEYIGGSALHAQSSGGSSTSSGTFSDGSDVCALTVPLAGQYDVEDFGCQAIFAANANTGCGLGLKVGAAAAFDVAFGRSFTSSNWPASMTSPNERITAAAGDSIRLQVKVDGAGGSVDFQDRRFRVRPVRVG